MGKFKLTITKKAQKEFLELPEKILSRFDQQVKRLRDNPYPEGCVKLSGSKNTYRIREGDYRLIYAIEEKEIVVMTVKHRREVYR